LLWEILGENLKNKRQGSVLEELPGMLAPGRGPLSGLRPSFRYN
jgi:hypothetical protein